MVAACLFKGTVCDSGTRLVIFELNSQSNYTLPLHTPEATCLLCMGQSEWLCLFTIYIHQSFLECTHRMDILRRVAEFHKKRFGLETRTVSLMCVPRPLSIYLHICYPLVDKHVYYHQDGIVLCQHCGGLRESTASPADWYLLKSYLPHSLAWNRTYFPTRNRIKCEVFPPWVHRPLCSDPQSER